MRVVWKSPDRSCASKRGLLAFAADERRASIEGPKTADMAVALRGRAGYLSAILGFRSASLRRLSSSAILAMVNWAFGGLTRSADPMRRPVSFARRQRGER